MGRLAAQIVAGRHKRMSKPQGNVQVSISEAFYSKEPGRHLRRAAQECANLLRRGGYANRLSDSLHVREVRFTICVSPVSRDRRWKVTTHAHPRATLPILELEIERAAPDRMDKFDFAPERFTRWVAGLVLDGLDLLIQTRAAPPAPDALRQLAGDNGHPSQPDHGNPRVGDDHEAPELPPAAPEFTEHFTDPIYRDQADEFAPFGSDEGSDILAEWADRRGELNDITLAEFLINLEMLSDEDATDDDVLTAADEYRIPVPGGDIDRAVITVSAAFTLLYLAGHIDPQGKQTALAAIDTLRAFYNHPEQLARQHADLQRWDAR